MWRLHRGTLGYVMVMAVLLLVIRVVGQSIASPSTPLVYAFLLLTMPAALVVLPLTAIADDAVGGPFNPLASDAVFTAGVLLAFLLNAALLNLLLALRARSLRLEASSEEALTPLGAGSPEPRREESAT